jgi:hypothetical protein
MNETTNKAKPNQGEGDKEASRRYDEATRDFVESGKAEEAAQRAKGQDPKEAEQAERAGKERAAEVDPSVHRDYEKPTNE